MAKPKPTPPALFFFLELPFGAAVGYLQIAIPYWLALRGVSLADIGTLAATGFIPHAYKIFWVPLLDVIATRRHWFGVCGVAIAAILCAASLIEDPRASLPLLTVLMLAAQACAATLSSALDSLMATTAAPEHKAAAGGWKMAGNVGGTGLLGTLPLWMSNFVSPSVGGLVLGALVLACTALILFVHEPTPETVALRSLPIVERIGASLRALGRDFAGLAKNSLAWVTLLICAVPVGTGALTNLFSGMAPSFEARQSTVEMVNGLAGGVLAAAGSILGGYIADRMNRRLAYCLAGAATALSAVAMYVAPTTEATYTWGVLLYCFCNGIAFAAFAGMVLELVSSGAGVTTKYALFVAVSNQAIAYTTWIDGQGSRFGVGGVRGTLATDASLTFAGILVLGIIFTTLRRRPAAALEAPLA